MKSVRSRFSHSGSCTDGFLRLLLRFHSDASLPSILRYLYSRILKGLAVIERTVAGHLRPPLFNGKVARHVRSLVLNGDVRLGY